MPVNLSVRQVRDALFQQAAGATGTGDSGASTRLLGTMFHEVFAGLIDAERDTNWLPLLRAERPDLDHWKTTLRDHAYRRLVGGPLTARQAALQESAEQAWLFWEAVCQLCDWIGDLVWAVHQASGQLPEPADLVQSEQPLEILLQQPGWSDSVRLSGTADAIWRQPGSNTWCVAELKLGQGHEQADLGQACLYHLMLKARAAAAEAGPLALVTFKPRREERLFSAEQLAQAQARLIELIGRLAGVAGEVRPATSGAPPAPIATPPTDRHRQLGAALLATLREYDAAAELAGDPIVGPAFVRYPLRPARGVRVRKIEGLAEEIRVRLELEQPPFISSESGQLAVDIQRPDRRTVLLADVSGQLPGKSAQGCAWVPVGVDLEGRLHFADLSQPENCHLLVAGTTGSGKSEWLRAAIAGLIHANSPETLRLVLIDPKRHAFNDLSGSPWLLEPVVYPDEQCVVDVLLRLVEEMERRYAVMDGADSLDQHARRSGAALPRIVCVCDEYFDLVSRDRKLRARLESEIFRLGAKARAAGIHLVLATQQPSREVIRGALDSNIPARVALKTNKEIESRMLLGELGAARLLGQGDLLFKDIGPCRRLQGIYVPPDERARVFGVREVSRRS